MPPRRSSRSPSLPGPPPPPSPRPPAPRAPGAPLQTDYVLTVAVSVAAGIAAITSAIPGLYPYRVPLCVAGVVLIAIANLRGVRESGRLFAVPTYLFIGAYLVMIGWGLARGLWSGAPAPAAPATAEPIPGG